MSKKVVIISFFLFIASVIFSHDALSAKKRVSRGKTSVSTGTTTTKGVTTSVKLRSDRLAVIINFSGLNNANSVSYQLTYVGGGISQGVMGAIQPSEGTTSRELLFGTCSKNVCRYHSDVHDARLIITSRLKSGLTVRKPYRIKV